MAASKGDMVRARSKKRYHIQPRRLIFAALVVLFAAAGVTAAINILHMQGSYAAAEKEYDGLRQYAPPMSALVPTGDEVPVAQSPAEPEKAVISAASLLDMNPDYIGWIRIDGTAIDYPVVRGQDNNTYLHTIFMGEKNPSGTIFMDAATEGFNAPYALVYGHNMKDGSMFAGLNAYLENGYLKEHPDVTIITTDGETLDYRVFAVRITDVTDPAFTLSGKEKEAIGAYLQTLNAPEDVGRALVLSTCTSGGDNNKRLLVYAALIENRL